MSSDDVITRQIIGAAYTVHKTLGSGFLERVYEDAMGIELTRSGLQFEQQAPITVHYHGHVVGEYYADLLIEGRILCELKAVDAITSRHEVQLVHYLAATGIETGLLLNFGQRVEIRRKFRDYKTSCSS
jgi:GxxExxY protein